MIRQTAVPAQHGVASTTNIDAVNQAGRLLDPDGWIDITEVRAAPNYPPAPLPVRLAACCGRPADDHPRADPTMSGTCPVHVGTEVSMQWNGRSYVCGLCATADFHAQNA